MTIEDPKAVRSVYLAGEWVMILEGSFEVIDDGPERMFRFLELRTGYRDHRARVEGPLASIVAVRSQADAP